MQLCAKLFALRGAGLCQALRGNSVATLAALCLLALISLVPIARQGAVHFEAGALRAQVSLLALPKTAALFSAFVHKPRQRWQSRASSRLQATGRANA